MNSIPFSNNLFVDNSLLNYFATSMLDSVYLSITAVAMVSSGTIDTANFIACSSVMFFLFIAFIMRCIIAISVIWLLQGCSSFKCYYYIIYKE